MVLTQPIRTRKEGLVETEETTGLMKPLRRERIMITVLTTVQLRYLERMCSNSISLKAKVI